MGVVTLSLISGAAQFALGRDLSLMPRNVAQTARFQDSQPTPSRPSGVESRAVNRQAKSDKAKPDKTKSDRATGPSGVAMQSNTISLRLDGFADTSFLVRLPVAQGGSSLAPAGSGVRKPMIACEPVVSVLTEIARRLEPGSCVT
jgi:hypothetical protein